MKTDCMKIAGLKIVWMTILMMLVCFAITGQSIEGTWNGSLDLGGQSLRVVFHVSEEGGTYSSTMDSPDQGANGIPTTATSYADGQLTITADAMQMKYEGKLSEDGSKVVGTFNQGPGSFPLILSREKIEKKTVPRAQDPKDFPYNQEEVKFKNPQGGHHLAGTLTIPSNGKFEKVVVLISGSGPQNRDEEVVQFNHRPFLVLSDHLTRNGIAVLRYDDRGVGESEGEQANCTSKDFAEDAVAAVEYLHSRSDMKGKKIGLAGHSEGGMIAPIVDVDYKKVDFMVLLAGPGVSIDQLMLKQAMVMGKAEGAPADVLEINNQVLSEAYTYIKENKHLEIEPLQEGLTEIFKSNMNKFSKETLEGIPDQEEFIAQQIEAITFPWFLYFLRFEPSEYLSKVTCPVLAINGELDLQVTAKENLAGIKSSLESGGNNDFTIKSFPGQNHIFQTATTGGVSEYAQIEETFNQETMEFMVNWINNLNVRNGK